MKTVYILMHQQKPNANEIIGAVCRAFQAAGIEMAAEEWIQKTADFSMKDSAPSECDAIIAVGGDGTLLRANALALSFKLPVLGINVGRVGFLTEVELDQLGEACRALASDEYYIEKRMMLKASFKDQSVLALNDVVVSRGGYSRLISLNAWVGEEMIGRFMADGLIVSTPTGSTGYSLSAGGPIVCPEVECMLLTPVCAHSLQHRPVVTSPQQTIVIQLEGDCGAQISVDGQTPCPLQPDDRVTITRAEEQAQFIRLKPRSFFSKIRFKLSEWSC